MNCLSHGAVKHTEALERNIEESVLAGSFHQLRDLAAVVHVHHNEQIFLCFYANDFPGTGHFF